MNLTENSTLKELVNETSTIKNDIVKCKHALKYNLTKKKIDTQDINTLTKLIDMIDLIKVDPRGYPKWYTPTTPDEFIYLNIPKSTSFPTSFKIKNLVYISGGARITNHTVESYNYNMCYDINTNTWTDKKSRCIGVRCSASVVDNKAYVFGGSSPANEKAVCNTNVCYDSITDTWTEKQCLPEKASMISTISIETKIYCMGGYRESYTSNNCYDTVTNTWTSKAKLPESRYGGITVLYKNKIYYFAGTRSADYSLAMTVLCYDILSDTWIYSNVPSIPNGRSEPVGGLIGDTVYCIGGRSSELAYISRVTNSPGVDCYNFSTNRWETILTSKIVKESSGSIIGNCIVYGGTYSGIFVKN